MADRPNILILVPDEMQGEVVDVEQVQIPNIRSIADDGVAFSNCFVPNPVCAPSRCCTFTGQYPHNAGHRSLYQLLLPHEENLFRLLKNAGYQVDWIGRNDLFSAEAVEGSVSNRHGSMVEMVMDAFMKANQSGKDLKEGLEPYLKINPFPKEHRLRKSFYYGERTKEQADNDLDQRIVARAIECLDSFAASGRDNPLCMYVCFAFPHPPYTVEEPYFSMYDRDSLPPIPGADGCFNYDDKPSFMKLIRERYGLEQLSEKDFLEIRATYYGMITRLDEQIGRILSRLKEIGEYDNTAIVLFADHGDFAGKYGLTEKWHTAMQDCLTRVPLFVRLPGVARSSGSCDQLVQTIDLFPTLLEAAGVQTAYTHFGRSLTPLITGEVPSIRQAVFAEGGYDPREPQCAEDQVSTDDDPFMGIYYEKSRLADGHPDAICRTTMIRTKEWKLIVRSMPGAVDELYHLADDPHELENLIDRPEHQETVRELKDRLLTWYLQTSDNPHWEHQREP